MNALWLLLIFRAWIQVEERTLKCWAALDCADNLAF
jgi:hypothetical protein